MSENVISVTQFGTYIKQIFDAEEMLKNIAVFGEVSGFGVTRGTAYFKIKDADASLECVKFGITEGSYLPKEGEQVLVRGSPNYYVKGGRFSFNVYKIEPYGLGVLFAQFLELKNKLEAEGLFSPERKKALPKFVRRIGVVTSPTGAVIQDIRDITCRRSQCVDIVLFPSKVQGVGAELEISLGIAELDKTDVDIIIVARGGGSAEDLSPFNTEVVARAIAAAKKPVVSAVGHETDFTIADFVADLRAPTPSAAAELAVFDTFVELDKLVHLALRMGNAARGRMKNAAVVSEGYVRRFVAGAKEYQQAQDAKIKELGFRLKQAANISLNNFTSALKLAAVRLDSLNPQKLLAAGYCKLQSKDGLIRSVKEVKPGDELNIFMYDGRLGVKVENKEELK